MKASEFRASLKSAGLRQNKLAELLGVDPATVNVWVNEGPRHLRPPKYAVNFVRVWTLLTPEQRNTLSTDET